MKCKKGYKQKGKKCVKKKFNILPSIFPKKNNKMNFIFFVLIAPILVKLIEWGGMHLLGNTSAHPFTLAVFIYQVVFFSSISLILYFSFKQAGKYNWYPLIPMFAYALKEIYNQFIRNLFSGTFSFHWFNFMFGVIIEPVVIYFIVSLFVWKIVLRNIYKV